MTALAPGHQQWDDAAWVFDSHDSVLGVLKWLHTPKEWERESLIVIRGVEAHLC